ncbi:MAG: hypothetical protein IT160_21300 [Bryobacterales bacterium]|nr:hypothetical protein [Bryobacterales bacterium]
MERRLWRCIERLPRDCRAVWWLSEFHCFSDPAIARRLNLPIPAVRSRRRRAQLALRRILRQEFGERL